MKIEGIVEVMDKLPQIDEGWSNTVQGRTVQVNGKKYRSKNIYNGSTWKAEWEEVK